jgi:hypothetical protein
LILLRKERESGLCMFSFGTGRARDVIKLPNHALVYGLILTALGVFVSLGSLTRLYELREFLPLRLPKEVNQYILDYVPFILGTFITTVAAVAGLIVGLSWLLGGMREISRLRIPVQWAGDFYRPQSVSLGLKEGSIRSYDRPPTVLFSILSKFWANARYISEIPGEIVRQNTRFIGVALALAVTVNFFFRLLELFPPYLESWGLGAGYVVPSAGPFYNLLFLVCLLKLAVALSLIPLRKPGASREMDSMIVEGKGHPSVFFAVLEEGSKIFAYKGFLNRISRSRPVACEDGETLIGTLIESFPEYVRTSARVAAFLCLSLGSVMVLVGFLQIILTQYPTFSVGYADFFRLHLLSLIMDIMLNVFIILFGKGFMEQGRSLTSIYRFRSSLVYAEAKGDFDKEVLPDLGRIISPERLFNPLNPTAFNVRYFSAEAISEAVTPEGLRELVGLETSARLAKDVARLKYLPFQVDFRERYPSAWTSTERAALQSDQDEVAHADLGYEELEGHDANPVVVVPGE